MSLIVLGPDGLLFEAPYCALVHDFLLTERHVVFPHPAGGREHGAGPRRWSSLRLGGGRPGYLGVVGRDAPIETINWLEGEPCFFFHVFNARSDGDKVVCDVTRNRRPSVFPDPDGTMPPPSADMPLLVRWTPDLGAGTDVVPSEILAERPGEFPRYDERFNGRPYRHAFSISSTRENGKVWSRRCGPLSQSKMWRLGRIVGACCPESGGAPSF